MKIVLLSDTHNCHESIVVPPCDLLVHAGDWSRHGTADETILFLEWLGRQPARVRVATPGNHDLFAAQEPGVARDLAERNDILWLIEEGAEVLGIKLWASPYSPRHGVWAFQDDRGEPLRARWSRIPEGLDLLVTHGPPLGVCDLIWRGERVGCEALLDIVRERSPRVHVFGHVHEGRGEMTLPGCSTRFINASSFVSLRVRNPTTEEVHPPIVIEL